MELKNPEGASRYTVISAPGNDAHTETVYNSEIYVISKSIGTLKTYSIPAAHSVRNPSFDYKIETEIPYQVSLSVSAGAEYSSGGVGYASASCSAFLKDGTSIALCSASIAYGGNGAKSSSGDAKIEQKLTTEQIKNLDYIKFSFSTTYEHHGITGVGAGGAGWGSCSGLLTGYSGQWEGY